MTIRIIIGVLAVFLVAGSPPVSPNDTLSGLINGVLAASLCLVLLLVLSRFRFVRSSPAPMQTLVTVLVCMLAVSAILCISMARAVVRHRGRPASYRNTLPAVEKPATTSDRE